MLCYFFCLFLTVFTAINSTKSKENLTLHHMGKILLVNLLGYNLKSGGVTFLKSFLAFKTFGMDFSFRAIDDLPSVH